MLRKFAYNKIFRTTSMLFVFVLLLLFPASKEYSLEGDTLSKPVSKIKKQEIFLIDKNGYVSRSLLALSANTDEEYANKLLELLIISGKYEYLVPNGFKAILPVDTKINSVKIEKNDITVDFSKEFLELTKENEEKAVEAITYNMTTIDKIKNVYIKVEGKLLSCLPKSKKILKQPLSRLNGINKTFDVRSYKGVNQTTIYYVNKNNSGYYYVPVTKINNDSRDKIKIIIDELTSSYTYETNLMSFLNYNTKLLDYELKDEVLKLDFNEFLFDDIDSKSILEEVIYSISLSIRDNYDVKEVIFNVNGKEITKSVLKNIE